MWGVFNYSSLWFVERTRREAFLGAANNFFGNEDELRRYIKDGSVRIVKVEVREIRRAERSSKT
jgi:hypothetical protein